MHFDASVQPKNIDSDTCFQKGQRITYVTDIKPIVETYCAPNNNQLCCHQADGCSYDYTIYQNLADEARKGTLTDRVFGPFKTGSPMPSNGNHLPPCDTSALRIWIEEDAPEH